MSTNEAATSTPPRQIVLIGLSGVGKSSVGAILAERLGWPLIDTDDLVTELEGRTPAELITTRGEPAFRKVEERVVAEAVKRMPAVISLGGGAFLSPRSRRVLGEQGLICWLDAAPSEIARRLRDTPDSTERPLLGEDLEGRLQELSDERRIHYSQADLWVPAQGMPPGDVAERILQAWSGRADALGGGARRRERLGNAQPQAGPAAIVDTGSERYPIWVGAGELMRLPERLRLLGLEGAVYVIADESVIAAHGELLVDALDSGGFRGASYVVPPGETSKTLRAAEEIYGWLAQSRAERGDTVVAFGGGVIGDLAGYVAATYLRGMPFVQIPTSVLAMNDAAIGGKVAVDLPEGKNLVGAFHQPRAVISDIDLLRTLPRRAFTEGLAEVVKHALILDPLLLGEIERHAGDLGGPQPDQELLTRVIARSSRLKALIVSADPKERGLRAILNYGHTIGHAIEAVTGYEDYLHGEAVAVGMMGAARIAERMGILDNEGVARQADVLRTLGLPLAAPGVNTEAVMETMFLDKKVQAGRLRFVLLEEFGRPVVRGDVPEEIVREVVRGLTAG
ncbi:MAG: 3-dehydroquinate synthase [Chloroflexi bacterium]|nr:3-dehydroquinate synthase [Chloroflexota bacterium]